MAQELKLKNLRDDLLSKREDNFESVHQKFNVFRDKQESNHNSEL